MLWDNPMPTWSLREEAEPDLHTQGLRDVAPVPITPMLHIRLHSHPSLARYLSCSNGPGQDESELLTSTCHCDNSSQGGWEASLQ